MRYRYCGDWDDDLEGFKKIKTDKEIIILLIFLIGFEPTVFALD